MTICRTCGQPLPSLTKHRKFHYLCQPSRHDHLSPAQIERKIAQAALAIRKARQAA